jgi:hypothetical protein
MDQVSIKYTIIFIMCKTPQNVPKFRFLVWKQTIWQPWFESRPEPLNKIKIEMEDVFWLALFVRTLIKELKMKLQKILTSVRTKMPVEIAK